MSLKLMNINGSFNSRPHTEVDSLKLFIINPEHSFNSRPHTEVDSRSFVRFLCAEDLSTHDLTRRSTVLLDPVRLLFWFFQLTTSHGGRQQISLFFHRVRIFFINLCTNNTLYFLLCIILLLFSPYCFILLVRIPRHFLFAAHSH